MQLRHIRTNVRSLRTQQNMLNARMNQFIYEIYVLDFRLFETKRVHV